MADFFLSDTDDSAVDQVLAEAMDHCVLEQVAAINCSSFTDSSLPPHLETRFHRLKTFPSYPSSSHPPNPNERECSTPLQKAKDGNFSSGYVSFPSHSSNSDGKNGNFDVENGKEGKMSSGYVDFGKVRVNSDVGKGKEGKLSSGYVSNCSNSSKSGGKLRKDRKMPSGFVSDSSNDSSSEGEDFEKVKVKSVGRKRKEGKFASGNVSNSGNDSSSEDEGFDKIKVKSVDRKRKQGKNSCGSGSFRSDSSSSETETVAKTGCFWCSPKRVSRKKSGKKNVGVEWGKHEDILSDLRSFSAKEQKKLMKRAMQEEEKINKEAEKIVKWAKQASARFEFSGMDDELSDDDDHKRHHFG